MSKKYEELRSARERELESRLREAEERAKDLENAYDRMHDAAFKLEAERDRLRSLLRSWVAFHDGDVINDEILCEESRQALEGTSDE